MRSWRSEPGSDRLAPMRVSLASARLPPWCTGLSPPGRLDPRGRGLCRVAHPRRDNRGRRHPARHGRHFDHVFRFTSDGPRGRGGMPHLADGGQDEAAARRSRRGDEVGLRQRPHQEVRRTTAAAIP
eukprot:scaffold7904_cov103-Isochrysis_galbana.AAC.3